LMILLPGFITIQFFTYIYFPHTKIKGNDNWQ
jgi:hypothetical protein